MHYLDLKREMRSWKNFTQYTFYIAGKNLSGEDIEFYHDMPFSISNFVNIHDNRISSFCMELALTKKDTIYTIRSKVSKWLKRHTPSFAEGDA